MCDTTNKNTFQSSELFNDGLFPTPFFEHIAVVSSDLFIVIKVAIEKIQFQLKNVNGTHFVYALAFGMLAH